MKKLGLQHGTRTGHNNYGCRCTLCVAADRAYKRDRYALKKANEIPVVEKKPREPDPAEIKDELKDEQILRDLALRFGH